MMDLKMEVYSPFLELLGLLEIQNSVMWENKAFSAGSFTLNSLITEESKALLVPENIIWIAGDDAGIIEYVQQETGEDGPYITVKGCNLTGALGRYILWGPYNLTGPVPEIMRRLVDNCCIHPTLGDFPETRIIPNLVLSNEIAASGLSIRSQKTGGNLLDTLEELGTAYGVPFGVRFNPAVPCMEFWARYGVNRSIHQDSVEPVFYSTELDDVLSSEYSYNSQNWRNVALVAGEGEGKDRVMVVVQNGTEPAPQPPTPPTPTYTIGLSVDPEGGGVASGSGTVSEGQTVTVTATASEGYNFISWQENGETVSTDAEYTFTVSENRKLTAVFAVKSRLPEGYTEVEYIESSGTQYINTGIKPNATTKLSMDIEPLTSGSSTKKYFFRSAYIPTSGSRYVFNIAWDTSGISASMGSYGIVSYTTINNDTTPRRIFLQMDATNKTATADDVTVNFTSNAYRSSMGNINLLTSNTFSSSYTLSAKLYSCEIHNNGELMRDFVPCISPNGIVGMYDLATNAFYSNAGTGTFTAGPAV